MKNFRRGEAENKGETPPSPGNVDRSLRILPSYPLPLPTTEEGDRDVI